MNGPVPQRLCVVIDDLWIGGAQLLLGGLAAGAREVGIELSLAYLHDRTQGAGPLRAQGVDPVLVPTSGLFSYRDHRRVRAHLASVAPDLVHTHIGAADVVGARAARSLGIPVVSTLHSSHWSDLPPREWGRIRVQIATRRRCDARIITVSESVRQEYIGRGWDRPERVVAVHNGILDRAAGADGSAVRDELGLTRDDLVVTMVGALARDKGQSIVAEAARMLADRFPRMQVLIVGDGPLRDKIAGELAELGGHAKMIGHRDDVPRVLAASDVLVYPTHVDALPTVVIEAMAAALPIITTAIGGVPEMVTEGKSAVLLEPPPDAPKLARALEPLLSDRDLRLRLGAAARRRFEEHFTISRWFDRLLPVYEAAAAPESQPRAWPRRP